MGEWFGDGEAEVVKCTVTIELCAYELSSSSHLLSQPHVRDHVRYICLVQMCCSHGNRSGFARAWQNAGHHSKRDRSAGALSSITKGPWKVKHNNRFVKSTTPHSRRRKTPYRSLLGTLRGKQNTRKARQLGQKRWYVNTRPCSSKLCFPDEDCVRCAWYMCETGKSQYRLPEKLSTTTAILDFIHSLATQIPLPQTDIISRPLT